MEQKLKNGEMRVTMGTEELLWKDRKRLPLFGLPWTFTSYQLTPSKLTIKTGLFTQREDEIRLYRVKDISYTQTLIERLWNTGTLHVVSVDASVPHMDLKSIKNAKKVKDVLSQVVEEARRANGVRTSEIIGNGGVGLGVPSPHNDSFGPELLPDTDGDGIPDCDEA